MSQRAQQAFTRNFTLQRQLEDKYLNLRRTFRFSRRRLDTLEEDCVASLYKLLLYAREKQGISEAVENSLINDVFRSPKSARQRRPKSVFDLPPKSTDNSDVARRPATAMSAKTYTQSYSFAKDGMNIDKTRRDRYMRTKAEREQDKENNILIERFKNERKESIDFETGPKSFVDTLIDKTKDDSEDETVFPQARPKTAGPHLGVRGKFERNLSRPQTSNALMTDSNVSHLHRTSTPNAVSFNMSPTEINQTPGYVNHKFQNGLGVEIDQKDKPRPSTSRGRMLNTPTHIKTVHENCASVDGAKSPISVRITTTRMNGMLENDRIADTATPFRPDSQFDNIEEEELLPLNEEDQHHLEKLTKSNNEETNARGSQSKLEYASRSKLGTTRSQAPSRNIDTPNDSDNNILRKSMDKTQLFLKQYSKKSKVFGYVVKTRSSIIAPRERLVSHRSPCITYQELVSIKASIKQHESKTKSLLQRSAKLSSYVDKLATAGEIRERKREMKESGTK